MKGFLVSAIPTPYPLIYVAFTVQGQAVLFVPFLNNEQNNVSVKALLKLVRLLMEPGSTHCELRCFSLAWGKIQDDISWNEYSYSAL